MWQAVISGLSLGFILALSVGPVIFTIIKQSLNNGHAGGFSFVAGVWLSDIIMVVISNVFSELMQSLLAYKTAIGIIGSIFLIGMGVVYIFFKKVTLQSGKDGLFPKMRKRDMLKIFSSGFLINTLNPNVIIFWLGLGTALAGKFDLSQRIVVFSVCIGINVLADILKVMLAGKLRTKLTIQTIGTVNKVSGTILIGFGVALFYGVLFLKEI